jgi:hypothetical protein
MCNSTPPCLLHGAHLVPLGTFRDNEEITESVSVQYSIDHTEPAYRLPWRDDAEQNDFLSETF